MKKLVMCVLVLFILGCVPADNQFRDGKYDYSTGRVYKVAPLLQNIDNFLYMIKVKAELEDTDGVKVVHEQIGIAFSVDGKHLIALKHIVTINPILEVPTPFGIMKSENKKNWEKRYVMGETGKEIELECRTSPGLLDVAVLWADGEEFDILPGRVGNSDELEVGHIIIMSRSPRLQGHTISVGVVGNQDMWEVGKEKEKALDCFVSSRKLYPGDSGNPAFAIRDGELELVGICQGTIFDSPDVGFVLRINLVMEEVRNLLWMDRDEERGSEE